MKQAYLCSRCGTAVFAENDDVTCTKCGGETIYSGYTVDEWNALPYARRDEMKQYCISNQSLLAASRESLLERKESLRKREQDKQEFANSFNEYYEYDVVTIINAEHGRIDKIKMMEILSSHAREGWKLHSIYSNELGKNAVRVLGYGVNSTACEDVLIFERRVRSLE